MLYLAQVIRRNFKARIGLKLLAIQRSEQLWEICDAQVVETEETMGVNDRDLVLLEISVNRKILKVFDAASELPIILDNLSKRTIAAENRCKEQEDEWELRKTSLQTQSQELGERRNELDAREEQLKLQELRATQSIARAMKWESHLQQARVKLQDEWETLKQYKATLDTRSLAE